MPRGYSAEKTEVHTLRYHFVWCPKYRKSVLTDDVSTRLDQLIHEKADELGVTVRHLAIQPDHVHLFVETDNPTLSANKLIQQFKGMSSRRLHEEFDFGLPSLWTRSYFVSTAGDVASEVIDEYIDAQAGA